MNRRGSIEIVLLVLLVLLVTSVALFNFIVGSKSIQANIYDARFIEGVYQKQDLAEFYIRQVGEEVIAKNSGDFSESFKTEFSKYDFAPPSKDDSGEPLAYPETSFEKMFTKGMQEDLNDLQKIISEGGFNVRELELTPKGVPSVEEDVNTEGNVLEITINSWEIKDFAPKGVPSVEEDVNTEGIKIEVSYFPKISLEFDLKN